MSAPATPVFALFSVVDWAMLLIIAVSMAISVWRGFAREALSLLGWVLAFVGANLGAVHAAAYITPAISSNSGRYLIAWAGIFVAVLLLAGLLARAFARLLHASGLGLLDRVLGTVFGFARALLIIGVLLFLVRQILPPGERDLLTQSQLLPYVDLLLDWALSWFKQLQASGLQLT